MTFAVLRVFFLWFVSVWLGNAWVLSKDVLTSSFVLIFKSVDHCIVENSLEQLAHQIALS